jgi:predicted Ser/Thr protein kinase
MTEALPKRFGRYEVIELVGTGAMGKVYKARDPNIDRVVAVKVIHSELVSQSEKFLERFRREAQTAGQITHPNIVIVYDVGQEGTSSYIVMEFLDGRPLSDVISGGLAPEHIIDFGIQICEALEYAHSHGLVHRDIKPENVMILPTGQIKITDFGLARLTSSPHLTQSGLISGTPSYMAPEQIQGQQLDGRTDIFALGCVMYEMIAGQPPFVGNNIGTVLYRIMNEDPAPSERLDNIAPQMLKNIVLRALSKNRDQRYQTCAEIAQDLMQCKQVGEAVGMIQPPPPAETVRTAVFAAPGELSAVNPFTYGNPITDPTRFYGRQREIEQVFSRLRNPAFESSSIVGERRVGKTSLLRVMAHADVIRAHGLDADKYIFVYNDLGMVGEATTPLQLWLRLLRTIRRQVQDPDPELNDIIAELRSSGQVDNYLLADFFDLLSDVGLSVVLLLDEFETITYNENFGPDFFGVLRSLAIHHDLALITSSRQELVDLCHSDEVRTSPFFNIFANINLRGMLPVEVDQMIDHLLSGTRVTFSDQDKRAITEISGYHPFFTQVAAHFMWDAYHDRIDEGQRAAYMRRHFDSESDPHFSDYCQHSTENERIVLTALALRGVLGRRGDISCEVDQIRQAFGRLDLVAGQLEKRSLVIRDDGSMALFSPAFEDWVVEEVFDLVGTADHDFQNWLGQQSARFKPEVREILPRVHARHRLWVGKWLSDDDAVGFFEIIRCFISGT